MKILITGAAGFIGFHLAKKLAENKHSVIGIDNLNDHYNTDLKYARLIDSGIKTENISERKKVTSNKYNNYSFIKLDIRNQEDINELFRKEKFQFVCHLAARAGIRLSHTEPHSYVESNINGFLNILEASSKFGIKHLCYASSSSIYGLNKSIPYSTSKNTDHPISVYAATKKSNELMAHCYSHLYKLPTTGLRFFTVYGPWGRPDMAYFRFTKNILESRPIDIYNKGYLKRDFTYIDDIINVVNMILFHSPVVNKNWSAKKPDPGSSSSPYKLYNVGNNSPVSLLEFIEIIEQELGKKSIRNYMPNQPGDMDTTWADVDELIKIFNYKPNTPIRDGIRQFVKWYKKYYSE